MKIAEIRSSNSVPNRATFLAHSMCAFQAHPMCALPSRTVRAWGITVLTGALAVFSAAPAKAQARPAQVTCDARITEVSRAEINDLGIAGRSYEQLLVQCPGTPPPGAGVTAQLPQGVSDASGTLTANTPGAIDGVKTVSGTPQGNNTFSYNFPAGARDLDILLTPASARRSPRDFVNLTGLGGIKLNPARLALGPPAPVPQGGAGGAFTKWGTYVPGFQLSPNFVVQPNVSFYMGYLDNSGADAQCDRFLSAHLGGDCKITQNTFNGGIGGGLQFVYPRYNLGAGLVMDWTENVLAHRQTSYITSGGEGTTETENDDDCNDGEVGVGVEGTVPIYKRLEIHPLVELQFVHLDLDNKTTTFSGSIQTVTSDHFVRTSQVPAYGVLLDYQFNHYLYAEAGFKYEDVQPERSSGFSHNEWLPRFGIRLVF